MSSKILDSVTEDLLSIPPIIFREVRRKLLRTALINMDVDISPVHFGIMKLLHETGSLHVAEIGGRQQIARPQMTHLIDRLVELDIVERETHSEDRRMLNIRLKDKGKTIIKEHDKQIINATHEVLSCLTDEELEELSISLKNLKDIFSKLE